ncbi:MAG: response regulator [Elusimicrobia bacterium]|nr:response regulator [Elusimicrobiota bacterium]
MAKILIIDDDFEIVSLLLEVLRHDGHEADSAGDPVEGMKKVRQLKPDLVILDYHMPQTTGAHLYESLRRNEASRTTPILFMSGEASPETIMAEITDSTDSRFLPKPIHLDAFRKTVKAMLSGEKSDGSLETGKPEEPA